MKFIDLRSDTVTWPTDEMRTAMAQAEVGDDAYGDDPTVNELENYGASLVGKEAGLFVPSGTFANQLALFTHCGRGDEVILDDRCHIVQYEAGASGIIAGVQLRTITPAGQFVSAAEIEKRIRTDIDNIHMPKTGLICLENAHSSGKVMPVESMEEIKYLAMRRHIPIHLDGARIFNAATALNIEATDIAKNADTVMYCLSKGLCAPVGSLLCGTKSFIEEARRKRQIMGGRMRQVGILAAAGLVALKKMRQRLQQDHETAFYLANILTQFPQIDVDITQIETNMVFFKFREDNYENEVLEDFFKKQGILLSGSDEDGNIRLVTHYWITKEHIDTFATVMKDFLRD